MAKLPAAVNPRSSRVEEALRATDRRKDEFLDVSWSAVPMPAGLRRVSCQAVLGMEAVKSKDAQRHECGPDRKVPASGWLSGGKTPSAIGARFRLPDSATPAPAGAQGGSKDLDNCFGLTVRPLRGCCSGSME